jgi:transcriptional regulator with XRE-family HTH domain
VDKEGNSSRTECAEEVKTNLQIGVEKQRAVYTSLPVPLLAQLADLHGITVREFATIFGISKSLAWEILNHRKLPSLDLAIRIARYWECTTDELFGWMVDDTGDRRPLLILLRNNTVVRLKTTDRSARALAMIHELAKQLKEKFGVMRYRKSEGK